MKKKYEEIYNNLERDISKLQLQKEDVIVAAEARLDIIESNLKKLRTLIITNEFETDLEEIHFFKFIKPNCVAKFIFNLNIIQIESKRPKGSLKSQKKYLEAEIEKLQDFFNTNHVFYRYFKGGETYSDDQYFLRRNKNVKIHFECLGSFIDNDFATNLDATFSKFLGYEFTISYLYKEITRLSNPQLKQPIEQFNLAWTGNKIGLIELIYALCESEVINYGNADIKELATFFEKSFNIELGDYYRAYLEIKNRKTNTTKFLDFLKGNLVNRIEKSEE